MVSEHLHLFLFPIGGEQENRWDDLFLEQVGTGGEQVNEEERWMNAW